jgi:glycosyltransferase involved in cell wall biosynthesis
MKNKKVIFYTVIDPRESDSTSGGPQTAINIINHIRSLGFNVLICTSGKDFLTPDNSLFNIYHDIFNDPFGNSGWFTAEQHAILLNSPSPYLFSECAYTACTTRPYGDDSYSLNNLSELTKSFVLAAKINMFASPLHSKEFKNFLNLDKEVSTFIYPREIDTSVFVNTNRNRDIEYLSVGAINYWKGTDVVIDKYKHRQLCIAGYGDSLPSGVVNLGRVPHSLLPEIYNRAKNFVHLPRWKEPFGRTVAEASLCGCNIIGNENIGALSCAGDLSSPDFYKESRSSFIKMIKEKFTK